MGGFFVKNRLKVYCIYTNKEISLLDSNEEHIIPLSLGGCNSFTIRVDKTKNAQLGTQIDGVLSKDYLIHALRRKKSFKGRSGKVGSLRIDGMVKETGEKVAIYYEQNTNYVFNLVKKLRYTEEEKRRYTYNISMKFDKHIRIRYTAKVLLGACYYIFGEVFKEHADHESLRRVMNWDVINEKGEIVDLPLGLMDEFTKAEGESVKWDSVFRNIFIGIHSSGVIIVFGKDSIIGAVGVGGKYIGAINFKANTNMFDVNSEKWDGVVVGIQNNKVRKGTFQSALKHINEFIKK
jgi:hypothetical protein